MHPERNNKKCPRVTTPGGLVFAPLDVSPKATGNDLENNNVRIANAQEKATAPRAKLHPTGLEPVTFGSVDR
jgi:hypothetical protein